MLNLLFSGAASSSTNVPVGSLKRPQNGAMLACLMRNTEVEWTGSTL
jgi:hypothetical protein